MTENIWRLPVWIKRGIWGAVLMPFILAALYFLEAIATNKGGLGSALGQLLYWITGPVFALLERMGIKSLDIMHHIVPFYSVLLSYMIAIGFVLGA